MVTRFDSGEVAALVGGAACATPASTGPWTRASRPAPAQAGGVPGGAGTAPALLLVTPLSDTPIKVKGPGGRL